MSYAYYNITEEKDNQLDDVNLFNWTATDEKMFANYTDDQRRDIGLENTEIGDIKPIEGVARMLDKSDPSLEFFITPDDLGPFNDDNKQLKKWLRTVWYMTLGWQLKVKYPNKIDVSDDCIIWDF